MGKKWERIPLTPTEIQRVIDETDNLEEQFTLTFLADTGCRVNEFLRMKQDWFDFDAGKYGVVNIPPKTDSNGVRGAKTKKMKHVPMTLRLNLAVHAWFEFNKNGVLKSSVWCYNLCKRCATRADIGKTLTPHVFRHSYARNAFYYGKLKTLEIAALLGHKDAKMVETVYLKIDDQITSKKLEESGWLG